jgi:hypothetical protein
MVQPSNANITLYGTVDISLNILSAIDMSIIICYLLDVLALYSVSGFK